MYPDRTTKDKIIPKNITTEVKYLTVVIPAKAGIQKGTECRIKSGMTVFSYLVAGLITANKSTYSREKENI
ncbi:MAG: hypothetical protein DRH90_22475 [Deltaproteobacteria bacterium]|nr:MAG: hypothetical protein DRH90_22475 [Deltaproteobacteria bacterium]